MYVDVKRVTTRQQSLGGRWPMLWGRSDAVRGQGGARTPWEGRRALPDAWSTDAGEDSWESLGLQGDPTSPFWRRSALVFFGRTDAKAEAPVLWPPHVKSWLIGKDSDPGRDWRQEEKGRTEDEMAGWHHWLNGCESERTPEVGDGQGGLACCDSWGRKESDTTERLTWTENNTSHS